MKLLLALFLRLQFRLPCQDPDLLLSLGQLLHSQKPALTFHAIPDVCLGLLHERLPPALCKECFVVCLLRRKSGITQRLPVFFLQFQTLLHKSGILRLLLRQHSLLSGNVFLFLLQCFLCISKALRTPVCLIRQLLQRFLCPFFRLK